jgi:phosphatidylglycerol:prolipoprotein diacylglycerol transferase
MQKEKPGVDSAGHNRFILMFPYIILLGRTIKTYQIMALLGIFSAGIYSCVFSKRENIDYVETILFQLVACIGVVFGSHLLYIIVNYKYIGAKQPLVDLVRLFFSGSVFYGGLIGGIGITYAFRRRFTHYTQIIEIVTPSIPLFHSFGRIGCFFNGCCFGVESFFGVRLNQAHIKSANGLERLPIQLIEATFNMILFALLHKLSRQKRFKSELLYIYLLIYSIGRFILEFYRGDIYRGIYFHLSTSQIISIIILVIVLFRILNQSRFQNNRF